MPIDNVTCVECGWVSFAVTRQYARDAIKKFNEWYEQQPPETKDSYGGRPSSTKDYRCQRCGSEGYFVPSKPEDCPIGCTIGPVIWEGIEEFHQTRLHEE